MNQVHEVVLHTSLDPYLTLQALADYSGLSQRTLRRKLKDPQYPLPHYACGDRILVRVSAFDRWMEGFALTGSRCRTICERCSIRRGS